MIISNCPCNPEIIPIIGGSLPQVRPLKRDFPKWKLFGDVWGELDHVDERNRGYYTRRENAIMLTTILAGEWHDYGDSRVRIVLRTQTEKEITNANRFMTHMEVDEKQGTTTMIAGHYDMLCGEAHTDFLHRHTAL